MADQKEPECQLRRRRLSGNPNLHLEVGFQITEGKPEEGTPSPSKAYPGSSKRNSAAFLDFKNKQQSFDIQLNRQPKPENPWTYTIINDLPQCGRVRTLQLNRFDNILQKMEENMIEECEEEEIMVDSDDEEPDENVASGISRAVTPTPIQDFGASVTHMEGPASSDFLRVKTIDADCYTDVSEDEEEEE